MYSAQGNRLNRRGQETRRQILEVAVRCLATGGSEAVSANLIAKEAGVTWGTIQHQFGDSDGVWAAVVYHVSGNVAATLSAAQKREGSLARRVTAIVDRLWLGFDEPDSRAVQNLRTSLPHDRTTLARELPATAEAWHHFDGPRSSTSCSTAWYRRRRSSDVSAASFPVPFVGSTRRHSSARSPMREKPRRA
jgi:AcrR family transcriptional regulator